MTLTEISDPINETDKDLAMCSCQPLLPAQNSTKMDIKSRPTVGVIGTGVYAMALTKKLTSVGYEVVMGSRYPSKRESALIVAGSCLCGVEMTSIERCITSCNIIFVGLHAEDYKVTLSRYSHIAREKTLIDISNRENRYALVSNAQHLAKVMPNSSVVKAFNTVAPSTLELSVNSVSSPKVYVASDDKVAKGNVMDLAKQMGFSVIDFGDLKSSLYLEDFVLRVFTFWKIPIFLTFGLFNLWSLYIIYIYFIADSVYKWEQLFLKVFNKPLCMTAITIVALTYMPGQIAAILQIYHGTKHQRFPRFLDSWLKSRKQLGIISYVLVVAHVIASTLMMSPTYYKSWYHLPQVTIPANLTSGSKIALPVSTAWMVWKAEAALLVGISAFLVMSVLAVTSIPSVADTLNWSEWRCVHSTMGTFFMLLSVSHVVIMGAPGWAKVGWPKCLRSITFLSIILPVTVLLFKFVFTFTPLRFYLKKIRKGWERGISGKGTSNEALEDGDAVVDVDRLLEEDGLTGEEGKSWNGGGACGRCCQAKCSNPNTPLSEPGISNDVEPCQCSSV